MTRPTVADYISVAPLCFQRLLGSYWTLSATVMARLRSQDRLTELSLRRAIALRHLHDETVPGWSVRTTLNWLVEKIREARWYNPELIAWVEPNIRALVLAVRGVTFAGDLTPQDVGPTTDCSWLHLLDRLVPAADNQPVCPVCQATVPFSREMLRCPSGHEFMWIYRPEAGRFAAVVRITGFTGYWNPGDAEFDEPIGIETFEYPSASHSSPWSPLLPNDELPKEEEVTTESLKELLGPMRDEPGKVRFNSEGGFSVN